MSHPTWFIVFGCMRGVVLKGCLGRSGAQVSIKGARGCRGRGPNAAHLLWILLVFNF